MFRLKKAICVFVCFCIVFLSSCTNTVKKSGTQIVASFYPVYIFVLNLTDGADDITLSCMAEQNVGCLHDYRLEAKDAKLVADADIMVINGAGMEEFIEDLYKSNEELFVIDSSTGIELIEEDEDHEEHGEEEHGEEHAHHHGANSHIWMSVDNAIKQVSNIADGLCEKLPQYKDRITANKNLYTARLNMLKAELLRESFPLKNMNVISFHEAYDYMARELSLSVICSIESDEGGEPSSKGLTELTDIIRKENVKALFTEPYYKGSAAEILSNETGVGIFVLNPVTRGEKALTAYEDIMRQNIETIKKAVNG